MSMLSLCVYNDLYGKTMLVGMEAREPIKTRNVSKIMLYFTMIMFMQVAQE